MFYFVSVKLIYSQLYYLELICTMYTAPQWLVPLVMCYAVHCSIVGLFTFRQSERESYSSLVIF